MAPSMFFFEKKNSSLVFCLFHLIESCAQEIALGFPVEELVHFLRDGRSEDLVPSPRKVHVVEEQAFSQGTVRAEKEL